MINKGGYFMRPPSLTLTMVLLRSLSINRLPR